jgi:hypothetical protein
MLRASVEDDKILAPWPSKENNCAQREHTAKHDGGEGRKVIMR